MPIVSNNSVSVAVHDRTVGQTTMVVTSSDDQTAGNHASRSVASTTTTAAAAATDTSRPLFTIPSQLKLIERNLHKEMARFCTQQLNASSQLFQQRLTNPFRSPSSSAVAVAKNCEQFLLEYKGAEWRHQQLQYQMPIHDVQLFRQPTTESKFLRAKQRKALVKSELCPVQQSNTCRKCKQLIDHGVHCVRLTLPPPQPQLVANSANVDSIHYYHIDCFTCAECRQIFVDLKAYQHCVDKTNPANYSLFCLRHFVEIYKPRCPYCDKLILDEECTEAEGKAWHIGHFCCTECKRSLGGKQYIMAGGEKSKQQPDFDSKPKQQLPYCLTCFDILFGELCEECGDLIGCEVGAIIHEGRSWHASDVCFRCSLCLKSLLGKPFLPAMDGRIYCSVTCSQAMISHQKERLRRQNKLQTLHSVKKSTQPSSSSLNNEKPTQSNGIVPETTATSNMANNLEKIAKSREEFLRSMTLDSSKPVENGDQKLKVFNLTQAGNYEEFIKKNNQCFTSKYDWSREQEFLNVIDASNCELSSLTTTTTTTGSDQNSEDNFHFALSNITGSLDRNFRSMNKPLLAKFPEINFGDLRQREEENQLVDDLNIHNLKLSHTSGTVAVVGQTSQESKFPPVVNNTRFEESKSSSLNSPSSSTGTAPIWTVSPPPEYYRVNGNDFDNSSQSSQQQDLARDKQKINGILKVNGQVKSTINYQEENDGYCSVVMDRAGQSVLTNGQYPFHSTPVTVVASGQVAKSNCKSVSFDPTIEEKDESKPRPIRRIHSRPFDYEDCSDSHSCSSCSTCSSSTDDDDDDDDYEYNLTNFNTTDYASVNQRNQIKRSQANNEACTIS